MGRFEELSLYFDPSFLLRIGEKPMSEFDNLVGQGGVEQTSPSYDMSYANMAQAKVLRAPNMKEKLELAVVQAEARLKDAQEAKAILDAHPELQKLLDILQRNHF